MSAPRQFEEGQRYRNGRYRELRILAVDSVPCPNGGVVEVIAYRYDDGEALHLRAASHTDLWVRL